METPPPENLHLSGIDLTKWLDWYKDVSQQIHDLPNVEAKANRYKAAWLFLKNKHGERSKKLEKLEKFFAGEYWRLDRMKLELDTYYNPAFNSVLPKIDGEEWELLISEDNEFYLPTLSDWVMIEGYRKSYLKVWKANYKERTEKAIIPKKLIMLEELEGLEKLRPEWLQNAFEGVPIYLQTGAEPNEFGRSLSYIDFAHFLKNETERLEAQTQQNPAGGFEPVQWKGTATELFSLMADLQLVELIETPERGGTANLARVICATFTDKEGRPFDFENVRVKLSGLLTKSEKGSKKRADFKAWT